MVAMWVFIISGTILGVKSGRSFVPIIVLGILIIWKKSLTNQILRLWHSYCGPSKPLKLFIYAVERCHRSDTGYKAKGQFPIPPTTVYF